MGRWAEVGTLHPNRKCLMGCWRDLGLARPTLVQLFYQAQILIPPPQLRGAPCASESLYQEKIEISTAP
jgi:hypothetical protein